MILTKTDQRVIEFYEECLADKELQKSRYINLRKKLTIFNLFKQKINTKVTFLDQRKEFRKSILN